MADQILMKDGLGPQAIVRMAAVLQALDAEIATDHFRAKALDGIEQLELKQRVNHLISVLHDFLPADFERAARLLSGLRSHWPAANPDEPLAGFAAWPFIDYIAEFGIDHPEVALPLLRSLTGLFSAEFAIRPFIIRHFEITYRHLLAWVEDCDDNVRRLVSEGTRPRLPWGQRLPDFCQDPSPVLVLLELLKDDGSETVRRSVANNLNDIAKDHPDQVICTCHRWLKNASPERHRIIRHATRSLVKAGHPAVFGLLGYTENPVVQLGSMSLDRAQIRLGESLTFTVELVSGSQQEQNIVIDYAVHHVKANGTKRPKVFKLSTRKLLPGEPVTLRKSHAFHPITTRKYYAGTHAIELLVNGKSLGRVEFELTL